MTTLTLAKKKWERKMRNAGAKWKKNVNPKAYAEGIKAFLGSVNPDVVKAYEEGVSSVTAEEFQSAVTGKSEKWARKLKQALA